MLRQRLALDRWETPMPTSSLNDCTSPAASSAASGSFLSDKVSKFQQLCIVIFRMTLALARRFDFRNLGNECQQCLVLPCI